MLTYLGIPVGTRLVGVGNSESEFIGPKTDETQGNESRQLNEMIAGSPVKANPTRHTGS